MPPTDSPVRLVGRAAAEWVGRLADRLAAVRAEVRDAVVAAAGRTLAEAAETLLRAAFPPVGPRSHPGPAGPPEWTEFDGDDPTDPWAEDPPAPPATIPAPPAPRWSWRAVAVAGAALLLLD